MYALHEILDDLPLFRLPFSSVQIILSRSLRSCINMMLLGIVFADYIVMVLFFSSLELSVLLSCTQADMAGMTCDAEDVVRLFCSWRMDRSESCAVFQV